MAGVARVWGAAACDENARGSVRRGASAGWARLDGRCIGSVGGGGGGGGGWVVPARADEGRRGQTRTTYRCRGRRRWPAASARGRERREALLSRCRVVVAVRERCRAVKGKFSEFHCQVRVVYRDARWLVQIARVHVEKSTLWHWRSG
jgi:hypothetical protein